MHEYGIYGHLLMTLCQPEVSARVNGKQSKSFQVGVGLQQG